MELLIKLGVFLLLAAIGFWRGRRNELAHLQQIEAEETELQDVLIFATRRPPRGPRPRRRGPRRSVPGLPVPAHFPCS